MNVPLRELRSTTRTPLGVACTSACTLLTVGSSRTRSQRLERPMCRRSMPTGTLAVSPTTSMRPPRRERTWVSRGTVGCASSASTSEAISTTSGGDPPSLRRFAHDPGGRYLHCVRRGCTHARASIKASVPHGIALDHEVVNVAPRSMPEGKRPRARRPPALPCPSDAVLDRDCQTHCGPRTGTPSRHDHQAGCSGARS